MNVEQKLSAPLDDIIKQQQQNRGRGGPSRGGGQVGGFRGGNRRGRGGSSRGPPVIKQQRAARSNAAKAPGGAGGGEKIKAQPQQPSAITNKLDATLDAIVESQRSQRFAKNGRGGKGKRGGRNDATRVVRSGAGGRPIANAAAATGAKRALRSGVKVANTSRSAGKPKVKGLAGAKSARIIFQGKPARLFRVPASDPRLRGGFGGLPPRAILGGVVGSRRAAAFLAGGGGGLYNTGIVAPAGLMAGGRYILPRRQRVARLLRQSGGFPVLGVGTEDDLLPPTVISRQQRNGLLLSGPQRRLFDVSSSQAMLSSSHPSGMIGRPSGLGAARRLATTMNTSLGRRMGLVGNASRSSVGGSGVGSHTINTTNNQSMMRRAGGNNRMGSAYHSYAFEDDVDEIEEEEVTEADGRGNVLDGRRASPMMMEDDVVMGSGVDSGRIYGGSTGLRTGQQSGTILSGGGSGFVNNNNNANSNLRSSNDGVGGKFGAVGSSSSTAPNYSDMRALKAFKIIAELDRVPSPLAVQRMAFSPDDEAGGAIHRHGSTGKSSSSSSSASIGAVSNQQGSSSTPAAGVGGGGQHTSSYGGGQSWRGSSDNQAAQGSIPLSERFSSTR